MFKNYLAAKEKFKPDYFLYENNKSAAQPIKDQISKELGVPLQYINSALVSAQNRQRFYAHNIPNVSTPEDRGILLKDVLETGMPWIEKSYALTTRCNGAIPEDTLKRHRHTMVAESVPFGDNAEGKAHCLDANYWKGCTPDHVLTHSVRTQVAIPVGETTYEFEHISTQTKRDFLCDITTNGQLGSTGVIEACDGKAPVVYEVHNGLIEIKGKTYPIRLPDGYYIIRKLTVLECKRLQTVPDDYIFPVSKTQAYKMLGNGWTVDVIAYILSHIPNIKNEEIEVLSMYDGMSCGHIALDKLGANVVRYYASEIDKYAVQTTMENYPNTIQLGDAFQVREDGWYLNKIR